MPTGLRVQFHVKPGRLSWNAVVSWLGRRARRADGRPQSPAGRRTEGRCRCRPGACEPGDPFWSRDGPVPGSGAAGTSWGSGACSGSLGAVPGRPAAGPRVPLPSAGARSVRSIERADWLAPRGPARPPERLALDPAWSACRQAGLSDRTCILMTGPSQETRTCVLIESCHRLAVAPHLGQPVVFRRLRPGRRRPGAVLASARRGPRRLRGRRHWPRGLARRVPGQMPRRKFLQARPGPGFACLSQAAR
jgi:hypothetical protein